MSPSTSIETFRFTKTPDLDFADVPCDGELHGVGEFKGLEKLMYLDGDAKPGGRGIICFVLRGPLGAVQFLLLVAPYLSEFYPDGLMPADLGYHSYVPLYPDHELTPDLKNGGPLVCPILNCHCYYGGSGLNAEPVLKVTRAGGPTAMWEYLYDYYLEVFEAVSEEDVRAAKARLTK